VDSGKQFSKMPPLTSPREATMSASALGPAQATIDVKLAAIFVSLELSRSTWLITSLSPSGGGKMSRHSVRGGDVVGLLDQLARLRAKAQARTGTTFPIVVIQEAGLDGFWVHRALEKEGIESHVVDAAPVLTSRRRRRAKTDRIDGEMLLRTLLAYKRGQLRVCSMVRAPCPEGSGHCPMGANFRGSHGIAPCRTGWFGVGAVAPGCGGRGWWLRQAGLRRSTCHARR
jgi:transposase